jgi:hypothetical protein
MFLAATVGALIAGSLMVSFALIVQDGRTRAATVSTRSVSCGANDFFPGSATSYYTLSPNDGVVFRGADINPTEFVCDPHLPNGAKVTRVDFTIRDASTSGSVTKCGLYRASLAAATAGVTQAMANVADTSNPGAPGTVRRSTTAIANASVQNADYSYLMRCQVDLAPLPISGLPQIGIFGADVVYQITPANG